ncbi:unnamed protein product [Notodromas monacha]|uniref:Condensin complex subunit 1 C-terminal domain-containing protein n=1 Tax=Notodromas monacha TaxID=399045 RepID=A0A7R9GGV6_9CRUS|nr:unnamed protein product [Notodromas monacha]CAG0920263.1 unnamed protein product [Notodromas monacha]
MPTFDWLNPYPREMFPEVSDDDLEIMTDALLKTVDGIVLLNLDSMDEDFILELVESKFDKLCDCLPESVRVGDKVEYGTLLMNVVNSWNHWIKCGTQYLKQDGMQRVPASKDFRSSFWLMLEHFDVKSLALVALLSQLMRFGASEGQSFTRGGSFMKDHELSLYASAAYLLMIGTLIPEDSENVRVTFQTIVFNRALQNLFSVRHYVYHDGKESIATLEEAMKTIQSVEMGLNAANWALKFFQCAGEEQTEFASDVFVTITRLISSAFRPESELEDVAKSCNRAAYNCLLTIYRRSASSGCNPEKKRIVIKGILARVAGSITGSFFGKTEYDQREIECMRMHATDFLSGMVKEWRGFSPKDNIMWLLLLQKLTTKSGENRKKRIANSIVNLLGFCKPEVWMSFLGWLLGIGHGNLVSVRLLAVEVTGLLLLDGDSLFPSDFSAMPVALVARCCLATGFRIPPVEEEALKGLDAIAAAEEKAVLDWEGHIRARGNKRKEPQRGQTTSLPDDAIAARLNHETEDEEEMSVNQHERLSSVITEEPYVSIFLGNKHALCTDAVETDMISFMEGVVCRKLFLYILGRLRDPSIEVQWHALLLLIKCLSNDGNKVKKMAEEILRDAIEEDESKLERRHLRWTGRSSKSSKNPEKIPMMMAAIAEIEKEQGLNDPLIARKMMEVLLQMAKHDSANIRRSALLLLMKIFEMVREYAVLFHGGALMAERSKDKSVSVRKLMIKGLHEFLCSDSGDPRFRRAWVMGVLPRASDTEETVRKDAIESIYHVMLGEIKSGDYTSLNDTLAVEMLRLTDKLKMNHHLEDAVKRWKEKKLLEKPKEFFDLVNALGTEKMKGAEDDFMTLIALFAEVVWDIPVDVASALVTYAMGILECPWNFLTLTVANALRAVDRVFRIVSRHEREALVHVLSEGLKNYLYPPSTLGPIVKSLHNYEMVILNDSDQVKTLFLRRLEQCDDDFTKYMEAGSGEEILENEGVEQYSEQMRIRCMFTVTHMCALYNEYISNDLKLLKLLKEYAFGAGSKDYVGSPAERARFLAAVLVALGQLAVQDADLAKKCVKRYRALCKDPWSTVRANAASALGAIMSSHQEVNVSDLSDMYSLLFDTDVHVRRTVLSIVIALLQQEYVKPFADNLFEKLLRCTQDSDLEMATSASYYLTQMMRDKSPKVFGARLPGAVQLFNGIQTEAVQMSRKSNFSDDRVPDSETRRKIYMLMASEMDDVTKLKVIDSLVTKFLGNVSKAPERLTEKNEPVIEDCLRILALKEMQLSRKSGEAAVPEPLEEGDSRVARSVEKNAKRLEIIKNYESLMQGTIAPTLIDLRKVLMSVKHPLQLHLNRYLLELYKSNKKKTEDLFKDEPKIVQELERLCKPHGDYDYLSLSENGEEDESHPGES